MSTQLAIPEARGFEKPEQALTPMALLQIAVEQNLDIDKLKQLMELEREWKRDRAREAFVAAMNAFKVSPPRIEKNKEVKFGQTAYRHATLDHVCDVVTKALSEHKISHRWKVEQAGPEIKVTCVLTHELGHSEETSLSSTADNSGSKNSIQAVGSTVTYLQRYTLLAATGLAAANTDNDAGFGALAERIEWIANARNLEELRKLYDDAKKEAQSVRDVQAMRDLAAAKDKRKKELQ